MSKVFEMGRQNKKQMSRSSKLALASDMRPGQRNSTPSEPDFHPNAPLDQIKTLGSSELAFNFECPTILYEERVESVSRPTPVVWFQTA